jgi:hypothetical protein
LYAPEFVEIISARQPPTLDITRLDATQFQIGVNGLAGQTVVLQVSTDLQSWSSIVTNTLATNRWMYTNTPQNNLERQFYRGVLP